MNTRIFEAFESREKQVVDYMAGCGMKYGMPCTCGPECRCKNCPIHGNNGNGGSDGLDVNEEAQIRAAAAMMQQQTQAPLAPAPRQQVQLQVQLRGTSASPFGMDDDEPIHVEQKMDFFGLEPPKGSQLAGLDRMQRAPSMRRSMEANKGQLGGIVGLQQQEPPAQQEPQPIQHLPLMDEPGELGLSSPHRRSSQRNPSIISYGGLRHMSMNSETTFGRAMSGLSALSIDWENLEDFDLEVDHSAHINNSQIGNKMGGGGMDPSMNGGRRSSFRRPHHPGAHNPDKEHVSFEV